MQQSAQPALNIRLIFALICVPILIGSVDLTAIVVILPQATLDILGPAGLNRADQALWAVTAYLLAYTISLAIVGRLSDTLSRKGVFIACIVIFIIGALWSGFATDFPLQLLSALPIWPEPETLPLISLVIGRVIQAIGAGASVSVGMALVGDVFPPEHRAGPISLIGALDSVGWVVGNLYAGLMLQILPSWRSLFLINGVIAVVALVLTVIALRGVKSQPSGSRFDWKGGLMFGGALTALTIGIESLAHGGAGLVAGSLVLIVIFAVYQWRQRAPLIDMSFVFRRGLRAALLANLVVGFALILVVAGVPLVINLRTVFLRGEGLLAGALQAGIVLCALTAPLIVGVVISERRFKVTGSALPIAAGFGLAAIGFLATSIWTYTAPTSVIALPLALIGLGLGLTMGPLSLTVVEAAKDAERGLASSLVLVMRLIGMTIGTPLAASLTIDLANQWATERVANLQNGLREVGRAMVIPPLAIEALGQIMMIGAVVCALSLVILYVRPALEVFGIARPRLIALLRNTPAMLSSLLLVYLAAIVYDNLHPAVLANPIARRLPTNIELYAGLNMQRAFLLNSDRPLNALYNWIDYLGRLQPGQSALIPAEQAPADPPFLAEQAPNETPLDDIVRFLFRPTAWVETERYKPWCTGNEDMWQQQFCFIGGLLSWVGPQAAFALLEPTPGQDADYLFIFQATNRNNAIQFAANLAEAFDVDAPRQIRPNVHILDLNEYRRIAINDAYVLVGTPRAVSAVVDHSGPSLASTADYQNTVGRLPVEDFLTAYLRSQDFDTDLRPTLESLFPGRTVEASVAFLQRFAPLAFSPFGVTKTLIGVSMNVDDTDLKMYMAANLPINLKKLTAQPVSELALRAIPDDSPAWAAGRFNFAGIAAELDFMDIIDGVLKAAGLPVLAESTTNPLINRLITGLVTNIEAVLLRLNGEISVIGLPGGSAALILPMSDGLEGGVQAAINTLQAQITAFGALSQGWTVTPHTLDGMNVVSVKGAGLASIAPDGLHYTLTADNKLVVLLGPLDSGRMAGLVAGGHSVALGKAGVPLSRLIYAYLISPIEKDAAALLLNGDIQLQMLYLDGVLRVGE